MSETTARAHALAIDNGPMPTNASASTVSNPALADDEEYSDDGFDSQNLRYNCNQLRAKIREFLGTKEMTLKEFLEECQVNPGPYYRFMDLNGRDRGAGNTTYYGASRFFYRRDRRAKIEKRKQKANDKKRKASEHREEKAKKARDGLDLLKCIQETVLGDEDENGFPPVYDDCDEIRKKISEFQGEKIVTQAAFLKAMGNVSANSLRSFMSMKRGAGSGAANVVYRKGYVFFEKKRTLEGGNKTKKRLENEKSKARTALSYATTMASATTSFQNCNKQFSSKMQI